MLPFEQLEFGVRLNELVLFKYCSLSISDSKDVSGMIKGISKRERAEFLMTLIDHVSAREEVVCELVITFSKKHVPSARYLNLLLCARCGIIS